VDVIVRRGEREERVEVRRGDDGYEVVIGGRTYRIDAARARAGLHSLRIDGAQHEVAVRPHGDGVWWVSTAHGASAVEVLDPLAHLAARGAAGKGAKRRRRITAYMPGRVVALLAAEGDTVAAGQGIVVLEAMKMENEIRAEHDGVLARILVQPGQAVEGGDPLFELQ
jgi:biotin carboxyl carrier protein